MRVGELCLLHVCARHDVLLPHHRTFKSVFAGLRGLLGVVWPLCQAGLHRGRGEASVLSIVSLEFKQERGAAWRACTALSWAASRTRWVLRSKTSAAADLLHQNRRWFADKC